MDRESVRLELLKLVSRHDWNAEEIISKAESLEAYVMREQKPPQSMQAGKIPLGQIKPKKSDTVDVLS